jgi:hypothetical protein
VCTMTGSSVLNGNVTLSCKSSSGEPIPHYKWTKNAPMSEVFFSPMQSEYSLIFTNNVSQSHYLSASVTFHPNTK